MNSLVTALPGLVPIFISAGGVNALAGVLFILRPDRKIYGICAKSAVEKDIPRKPSVIVGIMFDIKYSTALDASS